MFKVFFSIFNFEREIETVQAGKEQREGDTESEAGSRLQAVSTEPDTGFKLVNSEVMT